MRERLEFLRLLESGDISGAIKMATSSPKDRELLFAALGDFFLESKRFPMARNFYVESLRQKTNPAAEFGLGSVLLAEGLVEKSIPFLSKSSESEIYAVRSLR